MQVFEDLKVIELASVLAGPAVGMFFAELGAEVIKVENRKGGGDMTRKWKLPEESGESNVSAYFSSVNYGKKYIARDFSVESDRMDVHELIKAADIVIANFKKESAGKLGMDYKTLADLNPSLIYAQIDGFTSNPHKVAFDVVLQAETGFMGMSGFADRDPAKIPVALIDIIAAHQLKEGILIALLKKQDDGSGSFVNVSLEEAALASLANQASNYLMEGHIPQRMGSLHPNIAPYGEIFSTMDGAQVVLAIGTDQQFKALCDILKCTHLCDDDSYAINTQRVIHRVELKRILSGYIENWELDKLMHDCEGHKIPIGQIKDLKQVLSTPVAQDMILKEDIEGRDTMRMRTVAFHISSND
ncbi:MAG: CoA transferase [Bacteroidetes bacterium]|nr:MAG: CoA transferase [Bacteroidota bacterium]